MEAWKLHEHRIAHLTGGRRVAGSGCGYRKGDVWIGKDWMIECKTTTKERYTLSIDVLDKLARQSLEADLSAALVIAFHAGYDQYEYVILMLDRRGEFQPEWRTKRVDKRQLMEMGTIYSRSAKWRVVDEQQFMRCLQ